jgi:hypothetical protein
MRARPVACLANVRCRRSLLALGLNPLLQNITESRHDLAY